MVNGSTRYDPGTGGGMSLEALLDLLGIRRKPTHDPFGQLPQSLVEPTPATLDIPSGATPPIVPQAPFPQPL